MQVTEHVKFRLSRVLHLLWWKVLRNDLCLNKHYLKYDVSYISAKHKSWICFLMKEYLTVTLIGEMLQENVSGQCFSDFSSIIVVDPLQPNIYFFLIQSYLAAFKSYGRSYHTHNVFKKLICQRLTLIPNYFIL